MTAHELGHMLGLDHTNEAPYCVLTMWGGPTENDSQRQCLSGGFRHQSSLALGDVLGARALYPWRCPTLAKGTARLRSSYLPAWRRVCPTIQIFAP
ncbi:MAG: hypothetical protein HY775_01955 [Acidobacteria bacterium]|nr:hypothetical protein [Acidobacteriota bacterium]